MHSGTQRPNIVWIVLDTHRYDRLGSYGNGRGLSPNLDALAAQSMVFERAIAPAQWTIPSHASMFTGEFPSTHLTTQSGDMLDPFFRTAAEWLKEGGYTNVGFCNNPLVGVIHNGFTRGFDNFYNYGGAVPSLPSRSAHYPVKLLSQVWERYTQLLRRISYPIQNAIAQSEALLRLSLVPVFVPLWTRFAHFKGDTRRSIVDADHFIQKKLGPSQGQPHFVFINLFETHLPLNAPEPFISRFAPTFKEDRLARDFMLVYNTQALRWLLPMEEPFSQLEAQILSEMYDAEVAYQDHLLARLLETLDQPYHRDHTALIVVADHGEMLGEHRLMGHGFGVYEELVRVPLMIRPPGQRQGSRIDSLVSTAHLFHTILDLARVDDPVLVERTTAPLETMSLARFQPERAAPLVVSEAYAPQNVIHILERENPRLLEQLLCRSTRRAAYNQRLDKLVQIEGDGSAWFNLREDPLEGRSRPGDGFPPGLGLLSAGLEGFIREAVERQPRNWTRKDLSIEDKMVLQRLRKLGYLD
jgi:uncharacterized sulfatase